jgi:hypothetical protein
MEGNKLLSVESTNFFRKKVFFFIKECLYDSVEFSFQGKAGKTKKRELNKKNLHIRIVPNAINFSL